MYLLFLTIVENGSILKLYIVFECILPEIVSVAAELSLFLFFS
nr:MAG TPA: hypothetical protein [Caudoviricetes sp.]